MIQTKIDFLAKESLLNPKPDRIKHPLFQTTDFFDPLDLPQVRYEMLRTVRIENKSITEACRLFGFSREYFYKLDRQFKDGGFLALLNSPKAGRRPIIALKQEIVNFIIRRKLESAKLSGDELRKEIEKNYKTVCSTRTVERIVEKAGVGKKN